MSFINKKNIGYSSGFCALSLIAGMSIFANGGGLAGSKPMNPSGSGNIGNRSLQLSKPVTDAMPFSGLNQGPIRNSGSRLSGATGSGSRLGAGDPTRNLGSPPTRSKVSLGSSLSRGGASGGASRLEAGSSGSSGSSASGGDQNLNTNPGAVPKRPSGDQVKDWCAYLDKNPMSDEDFEKCKRNNPDMQKAIWDSWKDFNNSRSQTSGQDRSR